MVPHEMSQISGFFPKHKSAAALNDKNPGKVRVAT